MSEHAQKKNIKKKDKDAATGTTHSSQTAVCRYISCLHTNSLVTVAMGKIDVRRWWRSSHSSLAIGCYFYLLITVFNYYNRWMNGCSNIKYDHSLAVMPTKRRLHCWRTRYENCWFNIRRHHVKYKTKKKKQYIHLWNSFVVFVSVSIFHSKFYRTMPKTGATAVAVHIGCLRW